MANRKNLSHSDLVRARIRTSKLVQRLQDFVLGKVDKQSRRSIELSPHQVTAALGLIKKTLPDLESIEHLGEVNVRQHVVQAEPLTESQWEAKYGGAPPARLNG